MNSCFIYILAKDFRKNNERLIQIKENNYYKDYAITFFNCILKQKNIGICDKNKLFTCLNNL